MDQSLFAKVSKAVLKKLESSVDQSVNLYTKGNEYLVLEESELQDENGDYQAPKGYETSWETTVICFNYECKLLPTVDEIEKCLYNTFVKTS